MVHNSQKKHDQGSISSSDSSTLKSVWNSISHLFQSTRDSKRRLSTLSNESDLSNTSLETKATLAKTRRRRAYNHKKRLVSKHGDDLSRSPPAHLVLPPFSPTYCKANEFPYSNFYVKLPNGKWMIRYRSGNRDILGTDEFEGYMI